MIVRLYRKYVPSKIRKRIYHLFLKQILKKYWYFCAWTASKFVDTCSVFFPENEYYDAYRFSGKHGISPYPFEASLKYKDMPVEVLHDTDMDMPYVLHHGKRLYYPRDTTEKKMQTSYRALLTEQDPESAHRYVSSYDELKGKILLDVGTAEGIFALDAIEYVEKAYLFECNDRWMEPLNATFTPWKDKVEIVKKYVTDRDDENSITLDTFMQGKKHDHIHIKMDIEGAEQSALKGAKLLLTNGPSISVSMCTYHQKEDAKAISNFLASLGYTCEFTQGYFLVCAHLRKAVCRGKKIKKKVQPVKKFSSFSQKMLQL